MERLTLHHCLPAGLLQLAGYPNHKAATGAGPET